MSRKKVWKINFCFIGMLLAQRPPFEDAQGRWVETRHFPSKGSSFGLYECRRCRQKQTPRQCRQWGSAYALARYTQQCKTCNTARRPDVMWLNSGARQAKDEDEDEDDNGKPHLRHLCAACAAGVCHKSDRSARPARRAHI